MTRFARGGQANKKKPNEATTWAEMKADMAATSATSAGKRAKGKGSGGGGGGGGAESGAKVITRLNNGQYVVRIGSYERVLRSEAELRHWKRSGSERRRLERKQRRDEGRVCFYCRQPGHLVADCPQAADEGGGGAGGDRGGGGGSVCFRCGSKDHALSACPKMPRDGGGEQQPPDLPFASCFVCGRSGHLSRACPDNPRGLYPKGGGCLLCSSVEHLRRDCPMMQKRRAAEVSAQEVALPTASAGADDEVPLLSAAAAAADEAAAAGFGKLKKRTKKVKVVVL